MTPTDTARQIGVDTGTLARWERGEREPVGAFLARVESYLRSEGSQPLVPRGQESVAQPRQAVTCDT